MVDATAIEIKSGEKASDEDESGRRAMEWDARGGTTDTRDLCIAYATTTEGKLISDSLRHWMHLQR